MSIGEALDLLPRGKLPPFLSPKPKPKPGEGKPEGGSGGGGAIGTGEGGAIGAGSGTTKTYADLLVDGQKYTGELDAAITSKEADKVIDGPDIFQRYFVHKFPAEPAADPIKPFLEGDVQAETFVRYRLANKQDKNGEPVPEDQLELETNVITQMSVSKDRGTIVNEYSYAEKDTLKDLGQNPMRFSDQCFQAWEKEGGTNGLTTLVQYKVVNEAAKDAIIRGHRDRGKPLSRAQTWGPEDDTYKALTGSDNGRPFIYLLKDHHNALGDKKVTEIHTVGAPDAIIWYKLGLA